MHLVLIKSLTVRVGQALLNAERVRSLLMCSRDVLRAMTNTL